MMTGHGPNGEELTLPIYYIDCEVEIQIVLGFVYQRVSFLNTTGKEISGVFTCPTSRGKATVCSCDLSFGGKTFSTSVVDAAEADGYEKNEKLEAINAAGPASEGFDPTCFSMPFSGLPNKAEIIAEIRYVQELSFDADSGEYSLRVPMTLPYGAKQIFEGRSLKEAINYRVLLAPGTDEGNWNSPSHVLDVVEVSPGPNDVGKILTLEGNGEDQNKDLLINYSAWANQVTGSVLCEANGRRGGSFMAFLQPPKLELAQPLARKMIFLLDQSYSMDGGNVLGTAKNALIHALDDLQPIDSFMICGYDHETHFYKGGNHLIQATPQAIQEAKTFVKYVKTSGTTDILKPIKESTHLLQLEDRGSHSAALVHHGSGGTFGKHAPIHDGHIALATDDVENEVISTPGLPFVVLITDGAVYPQQEKAILEFVQQANLGRETPIRVSTFGIGPYCNKYFLSTLSEAGMGYSETCLDMEDIEHSMVTFLSKTKSPVLSDIKLNAKGLTTFPGQIPDLTVGAPLIIAGTYSGEFPPVLEVTGKTVNGPTKFNISSSMAENAPIVTMVETKRIECLIGRWYMNPSDEKRKEIVAGSVLIGVPCPLTKTVAYENPDAVTVHQHHKHPTPPGIDGGCTVSDKRRTDVGKNQHARKNNGSVAAVAGVAVVGTCVAAALAFGNAGATMSNASTADAMGSFFTDGSAGMMNMAGSAWDAISGFDYGGAAGDLGGFAGDAAGAIGEGFSAIPDALGAAGEGIGNAAEGGVGFCTNCLGNCGPVGECLGGAIDGVGGCIGGLFETVCGGDVCGVCGDIGGACGGIGDCASGLIGGIGNCAGGGCECIGGVLGALPELLGGLGECIGSIFEIVGSILSIFT